MDTQASENNASPSANRLTELNASVADALAAYESAIAIQDERSDRQAAAQDAYDELKRAFDAKTQDVKDKKGAWDQAEDDASAAQANLTKAQSALDKNATDVAAAQAEVAQAEQALTDEAVTAAEQRVSNAEQALSAAQAREASAQADIDAEIDDPKSNEGHQEWTALGLFTYIRDNSASGSAAYWDAQCAIDILTSGANSTGHSYKQYEGPAPDGPNAATYADISKNVDWANRNDTVSLDNVATALDFIDEYNSYRARENSEEGYSLNTNVGLNCRLMAVSEVQLDVSYANVGHTQAYHVGENLSWGYSDPFTGWYDEEKAEFKNGSTSGVGHYMNIVDQLPLNRENPTAATGFAVHTKAPRYGVAHGQVFHTTSGYAQFNPSITYSTAQFRAQWFEPYYQQQIAAGMKGTPEDVKAAHRSALAAAQADVASAQGELDNARQELSDAQTAYGNAQATLAAAQAKLSQLQGQTASLTSKRDSARATYNSKRSAANEAKSDYEQARAELDAMGQNGALEATQQELDEANSSLSSANQQVQIAKTAYDTAVRERDNFTNLASSPSVSFSKLPDITYNGKEHTPAVTVSAQLCGDSYTNLEEGVDYTVTYTKNKNAGTAQVVVEGLGNKGSGRWWGKRALTFTIKQAGNPITAAAKKSSLSVTYSATTAKKTAANITVSKAQGTVTYKNASSNATAQKFAVDKTTGVVTVPKGTKAGTYTVTVKVTATTAATSNYKSGSKNVSFKIVVNKAANPMKVAVATKTVAYSKVKAGAQTVAPITVTKAQGTKAFAVTKWTTAKAKSYFTVSKTTGKVTAKKGTPKGTYKFQVKVTAKGNTNYKSASKTVTVTIVVK